MARAHGIDSVNEASRDIELVGHFARNLEFGVKVVAIVDHAIVVGPPLPPSRSVVMNSAGERAAPDRKEDTRSAVQPAPIVPGIVAETAFQPHDEIIANDPIDTLTHFAAPHVLIVTIKSLDKGSAQGGGQLET